MSDDITTFEKHRAALIALAYRLLGDMARAEDLVREAWLQWQERPLDTATSRSCLLEIVTRLCLRELVSARARGEPTRHSLEMSDQISIAFLVVLQRLTPAERAVLLLRGAFDLSRAEVASVLQESEAACCQLLRHARENAATERRVFESSREEHRRLLRAFVEASSAGELDRITGLLAEDAMFMVDTGPEGCPVGCIRDVARPIVGAKRIAALLASVAREKTRVGTIHECMLNGQSAIVYLRDGQPAAAILISVADGLIRHIFVQTDARRLGHLGPLH